MNRRTFLGALAAIAAVPARWLKRESVNFYGAQANHRSDGQDARRRLQCAFEDGHDLALHMTADGDSAWSTVRMSVRIDRSQWRGFVYNAATDLPTE